MNDVLDEIHAAIRCCENPETVIGTMTRAVLKETLRRATAEIEWQRALLRQWREEELGDD